MSRSPTIKVKGEPSNKLFLTGQDNTNIGGSRQSPSTDSWKDQKTLTNMFQKGIRNHSKSLKNFKRTAEEKKQEATRENFQRATEEPIDKRWVRK